MTATSGLGARTSQLASPDLLRSVFRRRRRGVAVITAQGDSRPGGLHRHLLTSVSAEPRCSPSASAPEPPAGRAISATDHIGVHILGEHQQDLAATFARSGADRFGAPTAWREGPEGVPVLDDVLAWLVCRVVGRVPAADQRIVLAEVVLGDPTGHGRPLLYHQGRFNGLRD